MYSYSDTTTERTHSGIKLPSCKNIMFLTNREHFQLLLCIPVAVE